MIPQKPIDISTQFHLQHFPNGKCELVEEDEFKERQFASLFNLTHTTKQMVIEYEKELLLATKIAPKLYLQISAKKKDYNLGILKNLSKKLTEELRNNSMSVPTN